MKAIMLASGEGTRCYPFTYLSPKIVQGICGIPILEYMLSWFYSTPEIERLYITARNDSVIETLKNYIQKRKSYFPEIIGLFEQLGYKVRYTNPNLDIKVIRANGWGTGGDLRLAIRQITAIDELSEDFLVCNADYVITRKLPDGTLSPQLNLLDIINHHKSCKKALDIVMTIALIPVKREEARRFGVAQVKEDRGFILVRGFIEKLDIKDIPEKPLINAGIYVLDRDFILSGIDKYLPDKPNTNLEITLLRQLTNKGKSKLAAYLLELDSWFDMGTLKDLVDVNLHIARRSYKKF